MLPLRNYLWVKTFGLFSLLVLLLIFPSTRSTFLEYGNEETTRILLMRQDPDASFQIVLVSFFRKHVGLNGVSKSFGYFFMRFVNLSFLVDQRPLFQTLLVKEKGCKQKG